MKRAGIVFSAIGLAMVIALIFGVRWFGPHDVEVHAGCRQPCSSWM